MFGSFDRRSRGSATSLPAEAPHGGAGARPVLEAVPPAPVLAVPAATDEELDEARRRSANSGLELVDLSHLDLDPSAAAALPASIARRHRAAAVGRRFGLPLIAVATPENVLAIDDIYLAVGNDVLLVVAPERQIEACVDALYPAPAEPTPPAAVGEAAAEAPSGACRYGTADVDWYRIGTAKLTPFPPERPETEPEADADPDPEPDEPSLADAEPDGPLEEPGEEPGEEPDGAAVSVAEIPESDVWAIEQGGEAVELNFWAADHGAEVDDEPLARAAGPDLADLDRSSPEIPGGDLVGLDIVGAEPGDTGAPDAGAPLLGPELPGSEPEPEPEPEPEREPEPGPPLAELAAMPWWAMAERTRTEPEVEPEDEHERAPAEPERPWWGEDVAGSAAPPAVGGSMAAVEPPSDVGEILRARELLGEEQLSAARQRSDATGRSLAASIAELKLVGEHELAAAVAEEAGKELVDLDRWSINPLAGTVLPESVARRYQVLAIGDQDGRPVVATANPSDVLALDDIRTLLGGDVKTVVCAPGQIDAYLGRVYRRSEETDLAAHHAAMAATGPEAARVADLDDDAHDDAPVVKFVNLVLRQALNESASDVHIEPTAQDLVVRYRIDGVLQHLTSAPRAIQGSVTSRLKVMAGLDIAEHRVPQDGRFSLGATRRQVDVRLATLPTVHGEKIVLRILDKSTAPLELDRLGFLPGTLDRYHTAYRKPSGTILVTGPTGSGKSTTLYATLSELNSPERNVITVEDPVEYQLPGVNQVQVNPKAGLSFANALRSILRSDPDVVLVGEIRDRETATIAIEAALTGHLVLSCLHTNGAAATPLRLVEMGVEPFLVGSAVDCVLAQRLARVLCPRCAEPYAPNAEELRASGWDDDVLGADEVAAFRRAVGCQACSGTGYRGRIAVQEVMLIDEELERAILDRATSDEIGRLAVAGGMTTLRRDGLHKAALGITSLEEILRVVV